MLLAVVQLPSLVKAQKNAFEVAKTITEESDIVIYPITEFIGAIYKKQTSKYDLRFARALRKLYEKDEKNFIAMYKDSYKNRFTVFVRNSDEIESYIFEIGEAIPGIVSVLLNFYRKNRTKLFFIVSDSEEENRESKKIVENALEILNSKNENIHIDPNLISYSRSNPSEEDYELLIKRDTVNEAIRRYFENFIKWINKRKKDSIESRISERFKIKKYNYIITVILILILTAGSIYYYKVFYSKEKKDNRETINRLTAENKIEEINRKKNSFIIYILSKNIDKITSVYSDRQNLYINSTGKLEGYDNYIIEAFPQTGYYTYSIPIRTKAVKIEKPSNTSNKNCRKTFFSKVSEVVICRDSISEIDYLIHTFLNSKKLYEFSIFKNTAFLNTLTKVSQPSNEYTSKNLNKTLSIFNLSKDRQKSNYRVDKGEFSKI